MDRHVYPTDNLLNTINGASDGDVLYLHEGSYPYTDITKSFGATTTITANPGETVRVGGLRFRDGASNMLVTGIDLFGDESKQIAGVRFQELANAITIRGCRVNGNWGIKSDLRQSSSPTNWSYKIVIEDNEIFGAFVDCIQLDGARDYLIRRNRIHDPQQNDRHNDGIQILAGDGIRIVRNRIWMDSYANVGGPNQCIIIGEGDPPGGPRRVQNVFIGANLLHHWSGTNITLAGCDNVQVVNNTCHDSGDNGRGASFAMTSSDRSKFDNGNVTIWNNIFFKALLSGQSSPPAYCGYNHYARTTSGWPAGEQATLGDPLFVDRVDYKLASGSPCVNSGTMRTGTPPSDIDEVKYGTQDRGARATS